MELIKRLCEMSNGYLGMGELFISLGKRVAINMQDGYLDNIDMADHEGLSIRNINDEGVYFLCTSDISLEHMKSYIIPKLKIFVDKKKSSRSVKGLAERAIYPSCLDEPTVARRIEILKELSGYIKNSFNKIKHINIREICSSNDVYVYGLNGLIFDPRPLYSLSITAVLEKSSGENETVYVSLSQRNFYIELQLKFFDLADELIRKCKVIMEAKKFSGGNMPVILGPGIPATLLHEAVGHGLEADFNYKNASVFSGKTNEKIASSIVNVVDDGTIMHSRGSINFDDEGTPSQRTVLIENGILKSYMYDKLYALRMKTKSTGNGRRQSYAHQPIPRMTNTLMLNGNTNLDQMISSIDNGIMAMDFGTGQVDISSGQFSFNGSEAYKITNGKIDYPISRCVISGMGSEVMKNIIAVGNDFKMDPNGGTCGKNGQGVPVNLGQPSVLVSNMIVG